MDINHLQKEELLILKDNINSRLEEIKLKNNNNKYYLHQFRYGFSNWKIENYIFQENYETDFLSDEDISEHKYDIPYVENYMTFGTGDLTISLYSKTKKISIQDKRKLEDELYKNLMKIEKIMNKYIKNVSIHNKKTFNQEFKEYIRLKKINKILK